MESRGDAYGLAAADTVFHRELCRLGGNTVVLDLLGDAGPPADDRLRACTLGKPMRAIAEEHHDLLKVLMTGDKEAIRNILHEHITIMNLAVDYEAIQEERRRARG